MKQNIKMPNPCAQPMGEQLRYVVPALNCNMDELHAAIGRVQLKKLPGIIARRRAFSQTMAACCHQELKSIRLVEGPADCEGVSWFLIFKCDPSMWSVSKARFVEAVQAEGFPFMPGYKHVPVRQEWMGNYMKQNGWAMDERYNLVNVDLVDDMHFAFVHHEDYSENESADMIAALKKVEAAYLK